MGEVTGAAGKEGAQRSSGKQVYEGKVGGLYYYKMFYPTKCVAFKLIKLVSQKVKS